MRLTAPLMMKRVSRIVEHLSTSLWAIPALGAVLGVATGFATVAVDHATADEFGFDGGAEAARTVLSTIAAAMITFTGLVFSITIVALQLASGQFSPRIMRTFLRDNSSKVALATFVATFSYAFTVLRATRADNVPGISVNLAIVLVFASVAVFIHYINHIAHSIRASTIIEAVAEETRASVERVYPVDAPPAPPDGPMPDGPAGAVVVANAGEPGVVTGFDGPRMVARAAAHDAVVVMRAGVGDFVPANAPLLDLHGADPGACRVAECVVLGRERTMRQDVAFGLRQLVDLAAKALSPGINDPTTAVQAIDQIHDILRRLASRPMPAGRMADDDGVVRLVVPSMRWDGFVSLGVDEIRIYGAGSLQVLRRLRSMLEDLLSVADETRSVPLREQLRLLGAAAERELPDARDRRAAGLGDAQGLGS